MSDFYNSTTVPAKNEPVFFSLPRQGNHQAIRRKNAVITASIRRKYAVIRQIIRRKNAVIRQIIPCKNAVINDFIRRNHLFRPIHNHQNPLTRSAT